jgi:probable biosynthetic protein (TIGR04098 family)
MHWTREPWHLGMPHTVSRTLGEIALLSQAAHLHWTELGRLLDCGASRLRDADGLEVYASIYFVDLIADPERGLAAHGPDDHLEVVGSLGRFGRSMLDGRHRLFPAGTLPAELPSPLPPAPEVRLSFVLVALRTGNDDLRISTPANASIEAVPALAEEPDSYRIIKAARGAGRFAPPPAGALPLWSGAYTTTVAINRDRDLNGVGMLYFVNYVAFLDAAEREALERAAGLAPERLDGRVTVRRRMGYYGNALPGERLAIEVEAWGLDAPVNRRLQIVTRVRRVSDGRLINVATAERLLRE